MINTKRVLLLLPLFLAWEIAIDALFDSGAATRSSSVPVWMVVGFVVSALAAAGITLWYLIRRQGGKVPQQQQHTYLALLVAIVVAGFVSDALKGAASLLLGAHPWWVLIPIYTLGYAVCWAMLVFMLGRFANHANDERSNKTN